MGRRGVKGCEGFSGGKKFVSEAVREGVKEEERITSGC